MMSRSFKPALVILGGFLYLGLNACSIVPLQSEALRIDPPEGLEVDTELVDVPFNPQTEYQCGPAALATLLQWNGKAVLAGELTPKVFIPDRQGSLQAELIATARSYDLLPYVIDPRMSVLLKEVQAGNPVLVMQNLGLSWFPQWHYAVVVGYNLAEDQIVLRSGQYERHINSFALFERTWRRAEYWGVVIAKQDMPPVTATALRYVAAITAFEQLGKSAVANRLYESALIRWPHDSSLLLALGNNQFTARNWQAAEATYRLVLKDSPNYAPALNNLANALLEQGQTVEAELVAQRALDIAGPHVNEYQATLREIQARSPVNELPSR